MHRHLVDLAIVLISMSISGPKVSEKKDWPLGLSWSSWNLPWIENQFHQPLLLEKDTNFTWTTFLIVVCSLFVMVSRDLLILLVVFIGTLFETLKSRGILAAGTMRRNRTGLPPQLRGNVLKGEKRGGWRWTRDGNCLYVVWKDCSDVIFLTTMHTGTSDGTTVKRKQKGESE